MRIDGTPSPILAVGTADVGDLSQARVVSHKSSYELSEGTLAFTVTPESVSGRQGLFSKDATAFGNGGHFTVWIEDGGITARLQSDNDSYEIHGGSVKAGEPTSVAVSFGPANFKLFVGGEEVDRSGYDGGIQNNSEPIVIGASAWASRDGFADALTHEFKGEIADLGLYGEALSPDAIRSLAEIADGAPQEPTPEPEEPVTETPEVPSEMPAPILSVAATEVGGLSDATRLSHKEAYALETGTLAFTVTADSVSGRQGLFSKDATLWGDGGHLTVWIKDGEITARLQSDEDSYELRGGSVAAGEAASVAVSFGEDGFRLFVGGEEVDRSDYDGGIENNSEPIVIGASAWASRDGFADALTHEFKGEIADLGLYGEALSPDAIRSLAGATDGAPQEPVDEPEEPVEQPEEPGPVDEPEPAPEPEPANAAPVLESSEIGRTVTEGGFDGFALRTFFSDPDGDELQFVLEDAPGFASITDDDRLRVAPEVGDSGTYSFSITASDGTATSAAFEVTMNVRAPSSAEEAPGGGETGSGGNDGSNGGNGTDGGGDSSGGDSSGGGTGYTPERVSLTARADSIDSGRTGAQEWDKGVVLTGYDLSGDVARVFINNQPIDVGFGIEGEGSRFPNQIDYYSSAGGRSERLVIDFNGEVTDVVARIGMMGQTEGPNGTPETGIWKAYDGDGGLIDQGLLGPDYSNLGGGAKESGSYGLFPIDIDTDIPIERLDIEATQFDYGNGSSTTEHYGENSSEFNLVGLDFLRLEPSDDILV